MTRSVQQNRWITPQLRHLGRHVGPPALLSDLEPRVRRVLILASAVVFFETIFFTALAPMLPHYQASLGMSTSEAGIVTATYAAGALVGALPGGFLALRWGVRAAVLLGLTLLVVGSLAFGLASAVTTLNAARFVQGLGSAVAWIGALTWLVAVAPRARRGEAIGIALGAAVAGSLVGPAVGAVAVRIGTTVAFSVIGCLALALAGYVWRTPPAPPTPESLRSVIDALRNGAAAAGVYLLFFSALLFGALTVLAPLQLDDIGWSAGEIAAVFLASSVIAVFLTPRLGRWSDRKGRTPPIIAGLAASFLASVGLAATHSGAFAVFVVVGAVAFTSAWVPGTALLSDGIEQAGIGLAIGFVLFNLAWTPGFLAGAATGGWLAGAIGDSSTYLVLATLCALTLLGAIVLAGRQRRGSQGMARETR